MRITRATPEDLDTLVAFRDQAAGWLAAKGIDQSQEPWPTEDLMVEGMLQGHGGSGLRRPGPRDRAAGLGWDQGGRRGCRLAPGLCGPPTSASSTTT
jgi:hypothetical protein